MSELFGKTAKIVANMLYFDDPNQEAQKVIRYLKHVRDLPSEASEIY